MISSLVYFYPVSTSLRLLRFLCLGYFLTMSFSSSNKFPFSCELFFTLTDDNCFLFQMHIMSFKTLLVFFLPNLAIAFALNFATEDSNGKVFMDSAKILLSRCLNDVFHYQDTIRFLIEESDRKVSRLLYSTNSSVFHTNR